MRPDKLSKITCVLVPALWVGPSVALAEAECATWNTPQFFAVATPADTVRCLEAGADPKARDKWGWTPLHGAARWGSPEMVQALLEAGADPEARDKWGGTPLHRAAGWGSSAVVQALLEAGADPEARDKWGWTPLHWAAGWGSPAVVQALLDAGADPGARNKKGGLPFDLIGEDSPLIGTDAYWRLHDGRWK